MKERTGIQSVEVGFALVQALANATEPLMLRDLALLAGMNAAKAVVTPASLAIPDAIKLQVTVAPVPNTGDPHLPGVVGPTTNFGEIPSGPFVGGAAE